MDNPSQRNGLETLKCLGNVANTNIWPGNLNIWPGIMFTTRPRHWEVFIKWLYGLLMIIKWCHWILWEVPSLPKAELCISPSSPSLPPWKAQGCFFGANHSKGKNWPSIGSRCGFRVPRPSLSVLTRVGAFLIPCSGPASITDISLLIYFWKIKKFPLPLYHQLLAGL